MFGREPGAVVVGYSIAVDPKDFWFMTLLGELSWSFFG